MCNTCGCNVTAGNRHLLERLPGGERILPELEDDPLPRIC